MTPAKGGQDVIPLSCPGKKVCAELGNVTGAVMTRLYKKAKQDMEKKRGACRIVQQFRKASSQRVKT